MDTSESAAPGAVQGAPPEVATMRHASGSEWSSGLGSAARSSSVTEDRPKISRSRASSEGSAASPRSTCPARVDSTSASAPARDASRVLRAARSTTALTMTATST